MRTVVAKRRKQPERQKRSPPQVTPYLPQPPNATERYSYVKRRPLLVTVTSLVSFGCLAVSQYKFIQLNLWLVVGLSPFLFFTVAYYLIALVVNIGAKSFDLDEHHAKVERYWEAVRNSQRRPPAVDIMLPIRGEPEAILKNTWHYVREAARFYQQLGGTVRVFVLDDGADPNDSRLARIADRLGFIYQPRPANMPDIEGFDQQWMQRGNDKKAGNLRYGFWMSEFVAAQPNAEDEDHDPRHAVGAHTAVFDADFAPAKDYLYVLIPYMEEDQNLGIIQTPQYFRVTPQQNWLERGAGAVQELFYRYIQQSRNQLDGAICVGTNAIYRRAALAQNGGGPTLIGHSEDVHTGFDLRVLGWGLQYIPIALATGTCPDQRSAFEPQQYRWCMGSMSLLGSRKFWAHKMGFRTRACYLSGFCYYIHTAIFTFVGPVIPLVLLTAFVQEVRLVNYLLVLPSLFYNLVVFRLWHRTQYGLEAWAVKLLYGWAHAFALTDKLRRRQLGWSATGSIGKKKSGDWRINKIAWLVGGWGLITGALWIGLAVYHTTRLHNADFVPNMVSGLLYVAVTLRAISPTPQTASREVKNNWRTGSHRRL